MPLGAARRALRMPVAIPGPRLSTAAAAHSDRLVAGIAATIDAAGGWIGFDRFMNMALYEPGLGYYHGGAAKFGEDGDFVTAPEISPLFGRTLARQVAEVLDESGGDILELGPGTGRLAADVLCELDRLGVAPARYDLLDLSPELRARQRARIESAAPGLADRAHWLDALPERIHGVVIANEVFDALPVQLVAWRDDGVFERGVVRSGEGFAWDDRPIGDARLAAQVATLPVQAPYLSEINLRAQALIVALAQRLMAGALLCIDYGFGRTEYFHPQRQRGTLMCHHRHTAHDDPFHLPGLQDITAHVDFTALADAGVGCGLQVGGYATQARFLIDLGITDLLSETDAADAVRYAPQVAQVHKLLSPAEMGELFKVLVLTRGIDRTLSGFSGGDLTRLLR